MKLLMILAMGWAMAAALAACDQTAAPAGAAAQAACVQQPSVPAVPSTAFRAFLAARPTADDVRARYPRMTLVMPGDVATRELRMDCSRFFADTDSDGRVVGGRFG